MVLNMLFPSHKTSITYIEHCKLLVADERLSYVKSESGIEKHFSVPYGNTNVILLGPGTSLTHKAAYFLSKEGVMIGFVGGGGTPLYFASQNEYRPTEYMQFWFKIWNNQNTALFTAKFLQLKRVEFLISIYGNYFKNILLLLENNIKIFKEKIILSTNNAELLSAEALFVKNLYKVWASYYEIEFTRLKGENIDITNKFLDNGNYLAYGLAASMLWVLGISHSFAVSHGDTRRGGLVFDFADLIKDSVILSNAFVLSNQKVTDSLVFRKEVISFIDDCNALKYMFKVFSIIFDNKDIFLNSGDINNHKTNLMTFEGQK